MSLLTDSAETSVKIEFGYVFSLLSKVNCHKASSIDRKTRKWNELFMFYGCVCVWANAAKHHSQRGHVLLAFRSFFFLARDIYLARNLISLPEKNVVTKAVDGKKRFFHLFFLALASFLGSIFFRILRHIDLQKSKQNCCCFLPAVTFAIDDKFNVGRCIFLRLKQFLEWMNTCVGVRAFHDVVYIHFASPAKDLHK